jgi:hypothetical protein
MLDKISAYQIVQEQLHLARFRSIQDAEQQMSLQVLSNGCYLLVDLTGYEAVFAVEGFISKLEICPNNNKVM